MEQIVDRVMTLEEGTRFMVMAPVVRGRKGEYGKLLEQFRLEGYGRVRVDGELRRLDEEIELDKKYNHDISVVVDRLVMKSDLRRRLSESIEAAAGLAGGVVEVDVLRRGEGAGEAEDEQASRPERRRASRARRAPGELPAGRRRAPDLQRALRLPQLRHLDPRAGAADLLLQLAARRLRALPRARLPAGRGPRAGGPRSDPVAVGGGAAALAHRPLALLEAAGRGGRRGLRRRRRHALAGAHATRTARSSSTAPAPSATRSATRTASAGGAPTASASRGSSTTSSAATRRPTRTRVRERVEGYMAEQPCPDCKGARLRPESLAVKVGGISISRVHRSCRRARR